MIKLKKINKSYFYFIVHFLIFNIRAKQNFFIAKLNDKSIFIIYKCLKSNDNSWDFFHDSAFQFKSILNFAVETKLPVILVIPENIENTSALSEVSPFIEAARVAVSWSSAYFRFEKLGKVNIKVLKVNEKIDDSLLNDLIIKLYLLNISDNNCTCEEQMQNRIFNEQYIKSLDINFSQNNIFFESLNIKSQVKNKNIIYPKLNDLKNDKKRIVISGAAGFIGSFLTKELLNEGHQVIGLDSLICGSLQNLNEIINNKNFEYYNIDVTTDFDIKGNIDYCIHLASIPSPEFYYNLPSETLLTGLNGTKNFLELALRKNARFLFSSTSEVYGDPIISPQSEEYEGNVNPFGKRSQYDESKRGAETLIKLYFDRYKIDVRIARIFNTYGPYMNINDGRVITNFCKAILENKPLKIYGNGNQTRSFAFISDTVNGILRLLLNEELTKSNKIIDRVFNIGNDKEFTIKQLANKISLISKELLNKNVLIDFQEQIDPTDPKQRKPDLKRSNLILGYYPTIQLNEGLKRTLLYFYNLKN